jgi:hypothetical protein
MIYILHTLLNDNSIIPTMIGPRNIFNTKEAKRIADSFSEKAKSRIERFNFWLRDKCEELTDAKESSHFLLHKKSQPLIRNVKQTRVVSNKPMVTRCKKQSFIPIVPPKSFVEHSKGKSSMVGAKSEFLPVMPETSTQINDLVIDHSYVYYVADENYDSKGQTETPLIGESVTFLTGEGYESKTLLTNSPLVGEVLDFFVDPSAEPGKQGCDVVAQPTHKKRKVDGIYVQPTLADFRPSTILSLLREVNRRPTM